MLLLQVQKKKRELMRLKILMMITTTAMMIVDAMMTVAVVAVAMMLPSISHSLSMLDQMEKLLCQQRLSLWNEINLLHLSLLCMWRPSLNIKPER